MSRALAHAGLGAILVILGSGFGTRSFEYQLPSLHLWLVCGLAAALNGIEREPSGRTGNPVSSVARQSAPTY